MSSGIIVKSKEEIELIRNSSLLVGKTLAEVARHIKPGVTTGELDRIAYDFILSHNAVPSFKGYRGYPASLCISINEEVVHGIPGKRIVQESDLVSVDCGVYMHGFHGDSAYTFIVNGANDASMELCKTTMQCLTEAIKLALPGNRVGDISNTVQMIAERNGYGVVRELIGHGVGRSLHEKPDVPNYGKRGSGAVLKPGMVFAIEPMINLGKKNITQHQDGWTITTSDLKPSAHYEHTIAIVENGHSVLSTFADIEKSIELNSDLVKLF